MNKTRIKIANYLLGVPIACSTLIGSIWGLTRINWSSIDWRLGVGTGIVAWIVLIGILYWSGSKENGQETSQE